MASQEGNSTRQGPVCPRAAGGGAFPEAVISAHRCRPSSLNLCALWGGKQMFLPCSVFPSCPYSLPIKFLSPDEAP